MCPFTTHVIPNRSDPAFSSAPHSGAPGHAGEESLFDFHLLSS
jgi:hypothetical protein